MDRSTPIYLINIVYNTDEIGQKIPYEEKNLVYVNVRSVSRSEWLNAGQMGLNPAFQVSMFVYDYNGENEVEINDKRYGVYRTYLSTNDTIELYLEEKAGLYGSRIIPDQNT